MVSNNKEVSAQYRAEKAAFDGKRKAVKLCSIAKKRVSALSAFEDRNMLKGLGFVMSELKPCPFCGGNDLIMRDSEPSTANFNEGAVHFSVGCFAINCNMMPNGNLWHTSPEDAAKAWNTRNVSTNI